MKKDNEVVILNEEDFAKNPSLTLMGFKEGEAVRKYLLDRKVKEQTVLATESGEEVYVNTKDVALQDEEDVRIIISLTNEGSLIIETKLAEGVEKTLSDMVGLLELSKFDLMNTTSKRSSQVPEGQMPENPLGKMVDVTIEAIDFEIHEDLKDSGLKVGAVIQLPEESYKRLLNDRAMYLENEEQMEDSKTPIVDINAK
jgi:hypothetical protein